MHTAAVCPSEKSVCLHFKFLTHTPPQYYRLLGPTAVLCGRNLNQIFGQANLDHFQGKFQTEENNDVRQTYILKIEEAGLLLYAFRVTSAHAFT
jgi:hypothetical protein